MERHSPKRNRTAQEGEVYREREVYREKEHPRGERDTTHLLGSLGNLGRNLPGKIKGTAERTCSYLMENKTKILLGAAVVAFAGSLASLMGVSLMSAPFFFFPYPLHASCNVTWTFGQDCPVIQGKILNQLEKWKTEDCGNGQKCLYDIVSKNDFELKATHMTPKRGYIDDIRFTFHSIENKKGCVVVGYSTSRAWYALFDGGTNYCNLYNLIHGAGLDTDGKYSEVTRNAICTQYSTAKCD